VSVQTVATTIEIPSDSKEQVFFNVVSLFFDAAEAVLTVVQPEVGMIVDLMSVAFSAAAEFGGDTSITAEVAELQGKLNTLTRGRDPGGECSRVPW